MSYVTVLSALSSWHSTNASILVHMHFNSMLSCCKSCRAGSTFVISIGTETYFTEGYMDFFLCNIIY
jgi:hypothetical protein